MQTASAIESSPRRHLEALCHETAENVRSEAKVTGNRRRFSLQESWDKLPHGVDSSNDALWESHLERNP